MLPVILALLELDKGNLTPMITKDTIRNISDETTLEQKTKLPLIFSIKLENHRLLDFGILAYLMIMGKE